MNFILSPQRILLALAAAGTLFIGGYFLGKADQRTDDDAAKLKPLQQAIVRHNVAAAAGQAVEQKTVAAVAKTEARFKGIIRGVSQHATQNLQALAADCSLDPDGLRLWRAANANADSEPATSGYGGLPAAGTARLGQDAGLAGQPRGDGQGVSPVPGASPGPDGLAAGDGEGSR